MQEEAEGRRHSVWETLTGNMLLLLSHFSRVRLYATPKTAAHQASPSLGFSRQEHWSGLPFPSPGNMLYILTITMLLMFSHEVIFFTAELPGQIRP